MKTRSVCKRFAAACGAALIAGTAFTALPAAPVSADSAHILILGDSISSGEKLKSNEHGYYDYLAEAIGGTVTNLAETGDTTDNLIAKLETAEYQTAVAEADYICISIGANDLMGPAKEYVMSKQQEGEALLDTVTRLAKEGNVQQFMIELTRLLTPARTTAKNNIPLIEQKLVALNPDAKIVMQTLYNPFDLPNSFFVQNKYSESTISKYETLMTYVDNTLNFVNNIIRGLENTTCADIHSDFADTGWLYDRIMEKDVHPTALGHALIGASVLNAFGVTDGRSDTLRNTVENLLVAEYAQIPSNDLTLMKKYFGTANYIKGDINGDGEIQGVDAQSLLTIYLATVVGEPLETQITVRQMAVGDINQDGEIKALDAQYILTYFLNNTVLGNDVSWDEIVR